ncbi:hypothetical protein D3C87_795250 [compost metagenome]
MHTLHETVEVSAGLFLERQCFEEGVDQVSLAATHAAPEIQALDRRLILFAEQFAQQTRLVLIGGDQILVQTLQMTHGSFLRGVMEEVRAFQISLVSF